MNGERRTVSLPEELCKKIETRIRDTEFDSVEEYVLFVLEEVIKDEREEEVPVGEEDEEEVKKRLKALGYLD